MHVYRTNAAAPVPHDVGGLAATVAPPPAAAASASAADTQDVSSPAVSGVTAGSLALHAICVVEPSPSHGELYLTAQGEER